MGRRMSGTLWPLLALWLSYAQTELAACPARCQCDLVREPRTIDCSGKGLKTFPRNVSEIVEHLDLSDNAISELPRELVLLSDLRLLNLARNNLSSLPASLRGLSNLRELDLSGNALKATADIAALRHLPRLKVLYLTGNPLRSLDGMKNPSLQFLRADACAIEKLGNTSLTGFPELVQLNLAKNPLKEVNDPSCDKLEVLDLSKCQLKVLRSHAIRGFPSLIELRLADNPTLVYSTRYETLQHDTLQKIDVSRCELDRPGLHGLPALVYAKLSGNAIHMLPDRIFSKNRRLINLFLDYNHLESLNKSTFANLLGLQILDLSANGLKTVPGLAFRDNIELQFLNLSDNYLTDFPKLASSVVNMDLSSNLISKMDSDSLESMPRILQLDLSRNLLAEMPSYIESDSLKSLILKQNHIWTTNNVSLSDLPNLEKLDLSGNLLVQAIDVSLFTFNENLRQLYLQNNPWMCDCYKLQRIYRFLTKLEVNMDLLICHSPSNVTGYSWQLACANEWKKDAIITAQSRKTYGFILVSLLTLIVFSGVIVSVRYTIKLKRQAQNHSIEIARAEARERLRLLQRRNQYLREELREHASEPRIHPLELIGPPSYEEAVSMPRLARSLDALDSVTEVQEVSTVARMTVSSESLRGGKKRRQRRARRLRSLSVDNLSRREMRREERLRKARGTGPDTEDQVSVVRDVLRRPMPPTPAASKRRSKRISSAKNGTSTDDEASDPGKDVAKVVSKVSKTTARNRDRESRSGYRPSTDGES